MKVRLFDRLRESLTKTRDALSGRVQSIFTRRKIDEEVFEELEETLLGADVGFATTEYLVETLRREARKRKLQSAEELSPVLQETVGALMDVGDQQMHLALSGPTVILVVGVNGAGKTTSIGKLAHQYREQGKRVMLAAGDTFRAAAVDQLRIWGQRAHVDVIHQPTGSDAAAVIFDAVQAARARNIDILLCDTAGRLQNKAHLMDELRKVVRVVQREMPDAPHEVLLVLDATTGQNAISQARVFKEATQVTGIVLTKLDGTAKGGVVLSIAKELQIPVKWVATGEQLGDIQAFVPEEFARALFS